jgi:site-specific recombinase XerD
VNALVDVPANKGQSYPADTLTASEVGALRAACSRRASTGVRNRALIVLLWRSGLRCSEALDLRVRDVDRQGSVVKVMRGKGGKTRTVPIDAGAIEVLEEWLAERKRVRVPGGSTLFCTLQGGRLDTSYVRRMLPRLAKRAGIERRVHAHMLRHTFAAELAREGVTMPMIQRLLGHANLVTTSRYLSTVGTTAELLDVVRSRPSWNR